MSSWMGILCLLSALAATGSSYCYGGISIGTNCSAKTTMCPSGEGCGSSNTEVGIGGKNAAVLGRSRALPYGCSPLGSTNAQREKIRIINSHCNKECNIYSPACDKMAQLLAWTYECAFQCNFLGSVRLQQVQIGINTLCYGNPNCSMNATTPTENTTLNGLVCPSCLSDNSNWCYTNKTIQCRGDETMCLLLQATKETGSISNSTVFRGCATKSFCNLGSQSQNDTRSSIEVKVNCTRASNSGSTNSSMSVRKVVLTSAIVYLLLKLLF